MAAATFLCGYFLKLRHKVPSMVLWFAVAVVILYFAGGFGYVIYSAIFDPPAASFEFEEYDDDCPGPPYAVC